MKSQKMFLYSSIILALSTLSSNVFAESKYKMVNPSKNNLSNKTVKLTPNIKFKTADYVNKTNFRRRPEFKQVFTPQFQRAYLKSPPKYTEVVESLGDRLVVERTLTLDTKDPCAKGLQSLATSVCFTPQRGKMSAGMKADINKMRAKIKQRLQTAKGKDKAQALKLSKMTDMQLIDYALNKETTVKVIKHTSILPFAAYKMGKAPKVDLFKPNVRIPQAHTLKLVQSPTKKIAIDATKLTRRTALDLSRIGVGGLRIPEKDKPKGPFRFSNTKNTTLNTIMGMTYGRSYGDKYEVTFARGSWWHDRYYAYFKYNIEAGFGLRFPFQVDINSRINKVYDSEANRIVNYPANNLCSSVSKAENAKYCSQSAQVNVKARALNANSQFYRNTGVASSKVFNGKEFVLTIGASCRMYASIPGPDISYRCPRGLSGLNFNKDFSPHLGNNSRTILSYIMPGRPLGLGIDAGVGYAVINPGAALQSVNSSVKLKVEGIDAQVSNPNLSLNGNTTNLTVSEGVNRGRKAWGIKVKNPKYQTGVQLTPQLEAEVGLDLGIYAWKRKFGPYSIDDVAINLGSYSFDRHAGTPSSWNMLIETRVE